MSLNHLRKYLPKTKPTFHCVRVNDAGDSIPLPRMQSGQQTSSWRSMLDMLVSKIWIVAVAIDKAHLPEFTYRYQFTFIIITSFYFHNVTAYELFIVHEIFNKNMTFASWYQALPA